jgi:hypothetical protein
MEENDILQAVLERLGTEEDFLQDALLEFCAKHKAIDTVSDEDLKILVEDCTELIGTIIESLEEKIDYNPIFMVVLEFMLGEAGFKTINTEELALLVRTTLLAHEMGQVITK